MYTGAAMVETPTPSPPMKRATIIDHGPAANALHTAETKIRMPTQKRVLLRPNRSLTLPPAREPSTVPHKAALTTQPCSWPERFQSRWMSCSAPLMTIVSKPKRKPPSAAVIARNQIFVFVISYSLS